MNIYFRVRVNTRPGDEVFITGSSPLLGNYYPDKAFKMEDAGKNPAGETLWEARLQFDQLKERVLFYKYFVKSPDGTLTYEVGGGRRLAPNSATVKIESIDHWQEYTEEAPFLTDPFSHVFYGSNYSPYTQTHKNNNELIIRAVVPNVPNDCRIVLCGEGKALGNRKPDKGVKMARLKGLKWIASFSTEGCQGQIWKYKLAMVNSKTGEYVFETLPEGREREFTIPQIGRNETVIKEHSQVVFPPLKRKFAGCSVPLFSLKSESSSGCGEITDMKLLIDWAAKTGIKVLEILPLNDTTQTFSGKDSSPYKSVSSLAINPIYMSLSDIGPLADSAKEKAAAKEMRSLNRKGSVDYEDLYYFKKRYLESLFGERGKRDAAHPDFYKFMNEHKDWVCGYALFCALRDFFSTSDFSLWKEFSTYSEDLAAVFGNKTLTKTYASAHSLLGKLNWEDVQKIHQSTQFHIWLQFHLFRQLDQVIRYAHSKGIALKGELQMRVLKNSVDTWKFPHLFNGADKDGFASFNWKALDEENYMWWKKRIRVMSWYLDIYSLGDEPALSEGDLPLYRKMIPQLMSTSNMMIWGNGWESLRMLSVISAQKEPEKATYLSASYTSDSTSPTMRMWLGEKLRTISFKSEDKKQTFYDATAEECIAGAENILQKDSMFAVLPIQDWMSLDSKIRSRFPYSERISDPQSKDQVWKYRMHITLESLLKADSLNNLISKMISDSGR